MLSSRDNIIVGLLLLASFVQFAEKQKKYFSNDSHHVLVYRDGFALSLFVFYPLIRDIISSP